MVRGLTTRTTEAMVQDAMVRHGKVAAVRLIRDRATGVSRGFCFVEFAATEDATAALESVRASHALLIDEARVAVSFAKGQHVPETIQKKANPVASAAIEAAMALSRPAQLGKTTPAAAPVPAAAKPKPAPPAKQHVTLPVLMARLVNDPKTGYSFDAATGNYYDTSSGYFYDGKRRVYCSWDESSQTFVDVAPSTLGAAGLHPPPAPNAEPKTEDKEKQKKKKTLQAKKVAKDLARWQKKQEREQQEKALKLQQQHQPAVAHAAPVVSAEASTLQAQGPPAQGATGAVAAAAAAEPVSSIVAADDDVIVAEPSYPGLNPLSTVQLQNMVPELLHPGVDAVQAAQQAKHLGRCDRQASDDSEVYAHAPMTSHAARPPEHQAVAASTPFNQRHTSSTISLQRLGC
eukprot:m.262747 g.262747  ORF g.262747 m.262747 type:complete len:404 (+) comp19233_c0_seq1:1443-2654(+)